MLDIFDKPWTLLGAAVLVLFAMLNFRSIFPEKRRWWQLLLPAITVAAAFGLDFLVQTDLEKIKAVINVGIKAVQEENCSTITQIISDNYSDSYHNTKSDLMHHCRLKLIPPLVENNKKTDLLIEQISPPNATVILTVITYFDKQSYVYKEFLKPFMITKTKIYLQRLRDNRWLISRVELLELDRHPANWQQIK